jgi:hypothetical protein
LYRNTVRFRPSRYFAVDNNGFITSAGIKLFFLLLQLTSDKIPMIEERIASFFFVFNNKAKDIAFKIQ